MRRFKLIDWGAVAAATLGSLGCMGGGTTSPFASSTAPSSAASQQISRETGLPASRSSNTFAQSAAAGAAGISKALWDNPVSRAVKGAFASDAEKLAAGQQTVVTPVNSLAESQPGDTPTPELYTSMGLMAERAGNPEKAREFYEQALALAPTDAETLLAFGHFHDRNGRLDQATRYYLDAIHADPKHAGAHNDLGLCYARQGHLQQALELVRQAAQLRPDRPIYRNNAAKVLVEMGRSEEAVNELAGVLSPAEAQYNVGCFLAQSGRHQEARAHFAAAVRIEPNMESARAWLARLQNGTIAAPQSGTARVTALPAPSATASIPAYSAGASAQPSGPSYQAPADGRMPLITNVRPVSADEPDTTGASPLAQATTGHLSQPPASYAQYSTTLPDQSAVWPQGQSSPYLDSSDNRYQVPNPLATPGGLPGASAAPYGNRQPAGPAQYQGHSHQTPWGAVPSPYDGASTDTTPWSPTSLATAPSTGKWAAAPANPATVVNPYAADPWNPQQAVRQASASTMQ